MIVEVKAVEKAIANLMQKALAHFAGPEFRNEVQLAKNEFFEPLGLPDETTQDFETRMSQFYDWYFYTRPLQGFRQSPLEVLFLSRELRFTQDEAQLIEKMRQHRHSLFEFLKSKGDSIIFRDLFKNEKIVVSSPNFSFGFDSDCIFEARLIPHDKTWVFARGFCFHPPDAKKFILSEVKRHRKDPDLNQNECMLLLNKMNMRASQYRHVPIGRIYSSEPLMARPS